MRPFWNKSSAPKTVTNIFPILPPAQKTVPVHPPPTMVGPQLWLDCGGLVDTPQVGTVGFFLLGSKMWPQVLWDSRPRKTGRLVGRMALCPVGLREAGVQSILISVQWGEASAQRDCLGWSSRHSTGFHSRQALLRSSSSSQAGTP